MFQDAENKESLAYCGRCDLSVKLKSLEKDDISAIDLTVARMARIYVDSADGKRKLVTLDQASMLEFGIKQGHDGGLSQDGKPVHVLFEDHYLFGNVRTPGSELLLVPEDCFHMDISSVEYEAAAYIDTAGRLNSDVADFRLSQRYAGTEQPMLDSLRPYVKCVVDATGVAPSVLFLNAGLYLPPEKTLEFLAQCSEEKRAA